MPHNPLRRAIEARISENSDYDLDGAPARLVPVLLLKRALVALGGPVEEARSVIRGAAAWATVGEPARSELKRTYTGDSNDNAAVIEHIRRASEVEYPYDPDDSPDSPALGGTSCGEQCEGWSCTQVKGHTLTPHRARSVAQGAIFAEWALEVPESFEPQVTAHNHDAHIVASDDGMPEPPDTHDEPESFEDY